ncbi:MAG TPA: hypothetical protein EYH31_10230 [Anaerolineae bacterium]|nr:hypothetical protein [Anaerolineae bacterium]
MRKQDIRRWLPLAIAFTIGLFLGWFLFGWYVWPVEWTNALPQDLETTARSEYLTMVAQSYRAAGSLEEAQRRLSSWDPSELAQQLSQLAQENERAGKITEAEQLRKLYHDLGLDQIEVMTPSPSSPAVIATWRELLPSCLLGAAAVLILAGAALLLVNLRRKQRAAVEAVTETLPMEPLPTQVVQAEPEAEREPEAAPISPTITPTAPPVPQQHPLAEPQQPQAPAKPVEEPIQAAPAQPPEPQAAPAGKLLAEFQMSYQLGMTDYDESFVIEEKEKVYRGECGMGILSATGSDPQQVSALEVWLFDKQDIRSTTAALMSAATYQDNELRNRLVERGIAVLASPGTQFTLESETLIARGTVTNVKYIGGMPEGSAFSQLSLQLAVYTKS